MFSTDIGGRVRRGVLRTALAFGTLFATTNLASAQAWVAPGHVGSVNIVFQDVQHTGHLLHDGSELGGYDSESQGLLLEVDYAITDRFSITAGIPYIGARYIGPEPSFFGLEIDDCHCWNWLAGLQLHRALQRQERQLCLHALDLHRVPFEQLSVCRRGGSRPAAQRAAPGDGPREAHR